MKIARLHVLALAGCAVLSGFHAAADEVTEPMFKAPVRIRAGGEFLGKGRYFPSPMLHDVDGDGKLDLVVADLFGKVTVASRAAPAAFAAETDLLKSDGKPLKFNNW